ncbi:hypothetical protein [Shewanella sp. GXUN23E]|uniref:hypothetical protein n=1 Tax=Shewanella sp. GXUN23E TaxID=3422498 RepID=UPI003D7E7D7B
MKNLLIVLVLILAGGSLYYLSQQSSDQGFQANGALEYVPADTAVFSGQLRPFPLRDYLVSMSGNYQQAMFLSPEWFETPQERFFVSLYGQYMTLMSKPDELLTGFGLANSVEGYFYTLGLIPVIKMQVKDASAFYQRLDLAEEESEWSHSLRQIGDLNVRVYRFDNLEGAMEMLVADRDGWMTLTLAFEGQDPLVVEQSLGLKPVDMNMTQTTLLQDIVRRHGLQAESISFINHQSLVAALTQGTGLMGQQLTRIFQMAQDDSLDVLRTKECQQELTGIAANWPMTVSGFTHMSINERHSDIEVRTVVESNSTAILNALQSIRGHINPDASRFGQSIFSLGLGLNTDNLAAGLNKVWQELTQPEFQCPLLSQLQYELAQTNPAMLGMFTGMAQGAQGISMVVSGYEMDDAGQLKSLDAMVSLAVSNPGNLFAMSAGFLPQLAGVQLPEDGSGIDVTELLGLPPLGPVMLAAKGEHLVLYTGKRSAELANELAVQKSLAANGVAVMTADYKQLLTPVFNMAEAMGEAVPPELQGMQNADMKVKFSMDVKPTGLEMDVRMAGSVPQ